MTLEECLKMGKRPITSACELVIIEGQIQKGMKKGKGVSNGVKTPNTLNLNASRLRDFENYIFTNPILP